MKKELRYFLNSITDIIFPIECLGCKKEGNWFCKNCLQQISLDYNETCPECRKYSINNRFCIICQKYYDLNGIIVAVDYHNSLVQKSIKTFKYRFIPDISHILGYFLYRKIQSLESFLNFDKTIVIPVPLHKKRKRWRGFNQAEVLAEEFLKEINLDYNKKNLQRIRYTKPQAYFNRENRLVNLKDSFVWTGDSLVSKNIILIDDVATTGSTLEECAKVLKKAGANEIWGLVVAKG